MFHLLAFINEGSTSTRIDVKTCCPPTCQAVSAPSLLR